MVSVYFEKGIKWELIGVFESKYTLKKCFPALEAYAKEAGMAIVTRSTEKSINDLQPYLDDYDNTDVLDDDYFDLLKES